MSIFDYGSTTSYNTPPQNDSYWGADVPMYPLSPDYIHAVQKPMQPIQQHPAQGKYDANLANMANVTAPNYLNDFTGSYNNLMSKLYGMTQNQQQSTNAGLGQYNVGDAGLGMFDYQNSPLANYKISNIGENVGTGLYNSDLLNQLAGRVSSNLSNPDASLAMGLARDQIQQGQGLGARQQLTDSFAGLGGRGQGPAQAQMAQLGNTLNQQQSDAYRNIAMDTEKNAIAQAQALEGMRGGFYENQQGNQLQNAALNQQGQIAQGDLYKNLANIGLQSFEGARGGELQGATLGADTFNQARQRELLNAQLNNTIYQGNSSNNAAIAGSMAGMLPTMADFLKNQGNMDVAAQSQTYGNYQGLNQADISRKEQERGYDQQYQQQYQQWLKDMMSWQNSRGATGRQF